MDANSNAWYSADKTQRDALHERNTALAAELDSMTGGKSSYDGSSGTWNLSEGTWSERSGDKSVDYVTPEWNRGNSGYFEYNASAPKEFTYESAPAYADKYSEQIKQLSQELLSKPEFSYDPNTDPLYAQYSKQYAREGQRSTQDAMASAAAMTGGIPSTYAITAGQQAGDYYAAQMADKIPELYALAYDMYANEDTRARQNLSMLQSLEQGDYSKYLNLLSQYNTDRNFAYNQFADSLAQYNNDRNFAYNQFMNDREWQYQLDRDAISDSRYDSETAYSREQDAIEANWKEAETAAELGDYNKLATLAGTDPERATRYLAQLASRSGSGKSSGTATAQDTNIIDSMLSMGNKSKAFAYLVSQGYSNSKTETLWNLFLEEYNSDETAQNPVQNSENYTYVPGYGQITLMEAEKLADAGILILVEDEKTGEISFSPRNRYPTGKNVNLTK